MARLSKKSQQDLNDLPSGWSSRQVLLAHLCDTDIDQDISKQIRDQRSKIFVGTGWQLSSFGCAMLGKLYKPYVIANDSNALVTGRILMNLGRLINGPWHVHGRSMIVWDQSVYFELSMFDGNLHQFVDFRSPK
jgi:hypothetical protein